MREAGSVQPAGAVFQDNRHNQLFFIDQMPVDQAVKADQLIMETARRAALQDAVGGGGKAGKQTVKRVVVTVEQVEAFLQIRRDFGQPGEIMHVFDLVMAVQLADQHGAVALQPLGMLTGVHRAVQHRFRIAAQRVDQFAEHQVTIKPETDETVKVVMLRPCLARVILQQDAQGTRKAGPVRKA